MFICSVLSMEPWLHIRLEALVEVNPLIWW